MDEWTVIYDGSWQVVDVSDKRFGGQIIICDCGGDPWSEMNARNIAAAHNREHIAPLPWRYGRAGCEVMTYPFVERILNLVQGRAVTSDDYIAKVLIDYAAAVKKDTTDRLRADAERYRVIRDWPNRDNLELAIVSRSKASMFGASLDRVVDAARGVK